jgi:hypothetical protein
MALKPGAQLQAISKRFHFKIEHQYNRFTFYGLFAGKPSEFLSYITLSTGAAFFDFELCTTNGHFVIFTEMPFDLLAQIQFDSGKTTVQADGSQLLQPNYVTMPDVAQTGKLKISFSDLEVLLDSNSADYCIAFKARATQWQYYIVNKYTEAEGKLQICNKQGKTFDDAVNVLLPTGEEATLISSGSQLIPLTSAPDSQLILQCINGATRKTINKWLPNASLQYYGVGTNGNTAVISSPIYVYI